jgi:hypothetical protein
MSTKSISCGRPNEGRGREGAANGRGGACVASYVVSRVCATTEGKRCSRTWWWLGVRGGCVARFKASGTSTMQTCMHIIRLRTVTAMHMAESAFPAQVSQA